MDNSISIHELRQYQEQGIEHILLDIQDPQLRQKRIYRSLSVPINELERYVNKLPKDKPVVVYCLNMQCHLSSQALLKLQELGFPNILKMEGGVDEWEMSGYPVENVGAQQNVTFESLSRLITTPVAFTEMQIQDLSQAEFIESEKVTEFLEARSPPPKFDHLGYEVKTTDRINGIYLMINPDPRNLPYVPSNSLVICHHKISTHPNRIYESMLKQTKIRQVNIFNFHLAWDIMEDGVSDSFLSHFGVPKEQYQKVDLTYRGHRILNLGSVIQSYFPIEEVVARLNALKVHPSAILNPQCCYTHFGFIPGGGFVDEMIIEMREYGVDALISSDLNFVAEIVARELEMTLIAIDHYKSERYALDAMQKLLTKTFPKTPTTILEQRDFVQCPSGSCFPGPPIPIKL
jgi:putative NIF3 family GTP cyclohydrolase 1 type 2/rhodanese-related sulfurtransferase